MLGDLTGRRALVTGAGSGIGRAIARVLADQGATVAVTDLREEWAKEVAATLAGEALSLPLDVTDPASVAACVAQLLDEWSTLDILVNNVGVTADPTRESPHDREEDWDRTFTVNVKGTVFCCDAVIPHMQGRRYGKIVNIASMAGHASRKTGSAYAASKAAVLRYTKGLAVQLAPSNINVNAVCPGAVWTRFQEDDMVALIRRHPELAGADPRETFAGNYATVMPLGRPQEPEDIAKMVAFLTSEDARNVTGQDIHVDGGAVIRD
jgi:NAD(P)-dependent dehydrogenase (short-subunit alcohol dehydrogenase family)